MANLWKKIIFLMTINERLVNRFRCRLRAQVLNEVFVKNLTEKDDQFTIKSQDNSIVRVVDESCMISKDGKEPVKIVICPQNILKKQSVYLFVMNQS